MARRVRKREIRLQFIISEWFHGFQFQVRYRNYVCILFLYSSCQNHNLIQIPRVNATLLSILLFFSVCKQPIAVMLVECYSLYISYNLFFSLGWWTANTSFNVWHQESFPKKTVTPRHQKAGGHIFWGSVSICSKDTYILTLYHDKHVYLL